MNEYTQLLKIAQHVSRNLFVEGMDKEDIIQECLIHGWDKCRGKVFESGGKAYVARAMRNRIYRLIENSKKFEGTVEFADEIYHVKKETPVTIPIPKTTIRTEQLTILMLENDLDLAYCAEILKWSYASTAKVWAMAKRGIERELLAS